MGVPCRLPRVHGLPSLPQPSSYQQAASYLNRLRIEMTTVHSFGVGPIDCHAWSGDRKQLALTRNSKEVKLYSSNGKGFEEDGKLDQHDLRAAPLLRRQSLRRNDLHCGWRWQARSLGLGGPQAEGAQDLGIARFLARLQISLLIPWFST